MPAIWFRSAFGVTFAVIKSIYPMIKTNLTEKRRNTLDQEVARMLTVVREALEDGKGVDILTLDVKSLTDVTDYMVIATGTSDRHVKTLSDRVLELMKMESWDPIGIEGEPSMDWVLVDYVDIVVHIMRERARRHYDLESLWDSSLAERDTSGNRGDTAHPAP